MNKDWINQLKFIRDSRKLHRKNSWIIGSVLLLAQMLSLIPGFIFLSVPIVFGGLVYFFISNTKTAHIKCPKCSHGFGTDWRIAIGRGTDNCHNCGLSLYQDKRFSDSHDDWK